MSHLRDQIANLRAELAALEAVQAAEDSEQGRADQNRPAGIPPTWRPLLFKVNGVFATVAWHDPDFTISALRRVIPLPPTPPQGGQP